MKLQERVGQGRYVVQIDPYLYERTIFWYIYLFQRLGVGFVSSTPELSRNSAKSYGSAENKIFQQNRSTQLAL